MTINLLVPGRHFVVIPECECRHFILHLFSNGIAPQRIVISGINIERLLDRLRELNTVLMGTVPISSLDFVDDTVPLPSGLTGPPFVCGCAVYPTGDSEFCCFDRIGFLDRS
jgi:hypothetical protein